MSVLIKGMKMPASCYFCDITDTSFIHCQAFYPRKLLEDDCEERRPEWCPLVELPEHHGRLIDADELKTAFPRCNNNMDIKIASVRATINHMSPIIEAEGVEE